MMKPRILFWLRFLLIGFALVVLGYLLYLGLYHTDAGKALLHCSSFYGEFVLFPFSHFF